MDSKDSKANASEDKDGIIKKSAKFIWNAAKKY